ncbi:type I-MYXAN CRISPR-associated protein Cas5/Cmx5/DevS [Trichothermofontia sichuanensis B231]|uniref:type I-MYXAN CRISPR-associated protein Cas5/Cmx5/DevS n=1 Tax=Trichothermofontia sichuanensis TaxID=3045816 RepID=UPI002246610F|nr:type I-MYXAN CRISPR-associated protein Cas5/Cmx5/DevS [Trichothermofontia sichuanensis]UZQ55107.1 type I-MYXAN CRISPR-associated protein Cas5/Cmx5/DevS [Trichothermofontia sichuanensis B231]
MMFSLQVEVPIACFRQSRAREYAETYPVPPPSTVYGMLLSLVGETNRYRHCGVELAIALLSHPDKSTVIRTFRRFKKKEISAPENARPDYQELLTDVQFVVWLRPGNDTHPDHLVDRLLRAFRDPSSIDRFGGLSLGESRDLVNAIFPFAGARDDQLLQWLTKDEDGLLTLPYWVDHVGSRGTRWLRYSLQAPAAQPNPVESAWTEIKPS